MGEMWARYRRLLLGGGHRVAGEHGREVDLALLAAALPGDDELRAGHAARDQPLLAGEGAVAGELVLDGLVRGRGRGRGRRKGQEQGQG